MKKILFFCSGGGYGHLARTNAIVPLLNSKAKIVVTSKEEAWPFEQHKNFEYISLPHINLRTRLFDKVIGIQKWDGEKATTINDYRRHLLTLFNIADRQNPDLIIVDSTPEIALFFKFLGFKVIYVYETLKTSELRFDLAWRNCDGIIFPYPEIIADYMKFHFKEKACFCGGYTRFDRNVRPFNKHRNDILITFGKGLGSEKIMKQILEVVTSARKKVAVLQGGISRSLLQQFPIRVIANTDGENIASEIAGSEILICGAGYNTLMEAFYLRKKIISIPLEKVYKEQEVKAKAFEDMGALEVLDSKNIHLLIEKIKKLEKVSIDRLADIQNNIVDGKGGMRAANFIMDVLNGKPSF